MGGDRCAGVVGSSGVCSPGMIPAHPYARRGQSPGGSSSTARYAGLPNAADRSAPGWPQVESGAQAQAILRSCAAATLGRPPRRVRGIRQTCPISVRQKREANDESCCVSVNQSDRLRDLAAQPGSGGRRTPAGHAGMVCVAGPRVRAVHLATRGQRGIRGRRGCCAGASSLPAGNPSPRNHRGRGRTCGQARCERSRSSEGRGRRPPHRRCRGPRGRLPPDLELQTHRERHNAPSYRSCVQRGRIRAARDLHTRGADE